MSITYGFLNFVTQYKDKLDKGEDTKDTELVNFVKRETGLAKKIDKTQRYIEAVTDIPAYLTKKKSELEQVKNDSAQLFATEFNNFARQGLTDEEAIKRAKELVSSIEEKKVKMINEKYPLGDELVKKFGGKDYSN